MNFCLVLQTYERYIRYQDKHLNLYMKDIKTQKMILYVWNLQKGENGRLKMEQNKTHSSDNLMR